MKLVKKILKGIGIFFLVFIIIGIFASRGDKKEADTNQVETEPKPLEVVENVENKPEEVKKEVKEDPKLEDNVSSEFKTALKKGQQYADLMHMSKQGIYDQLTSEYGEKFPQDAAEYAVENMNADWNVNALKKAETYATTMHMSKKGIYEQLVSEHGEQFQPEEAQYAIDNIEHDWNANALEKAKTYQNTMNMSKEGIRDQLTSPYGEQFTAEEATYAIENLE